MSDGLVGGIGAAIAALFFGTQTIFVKTDTLVNVAKTQTNIVILAFGTGIFVFSLGLMIVLAAGAIPSEAPQTNGGWPTPFTWEGFAMAFFFAPAKMLLLIAVRVVGVSISNAIVAGILSAVSWVVGIAILDEAFHPVAVGGILLFLLGVLGMSYVRYRSHDPLIPSGCNKRLSAKSDQDFAPEQVSSIELAVPGDVESQESILEQSKPFLKTKLGGMIIAVCSGTLYGFQGVPISYSVPNASLENSASAGITTMFILLIINVPCILYRKRKTGATLKSMFDVREGQTWGQVFRLMLVPMCGGICYGIGSIGQQLSMARLGSATGLPLSQLQLIVSGVWGIFLYKEIARSCHIITYFIFALVAIGGAVLLHPPWIKD
mmetsp:Transcript_14033/g.22924  ORF Transcript_14033/g.22924 Transcript_14033/m.22924 type:complete len:377 (-) Transcript_14033:48-1178(-)